MSRRAFAKRGAKRGKRGRRHQGVARPDDFPIFDDSLGNFSFDADVLELAAYTGVIAKQAGSKKANATQKQAARCRSSPIKTRSVTRRRQNQKCRHDSNSIASDVHSSPRPPQPKRRQPTNLDDALFISTCEADIESGVVEESGDSGSSSSITTGDSEMHKFQTLFQRGFKKIDSPVKEMERRRKRRHQYRRQFPRHGFDTLGDRLCETSDDFSADDISIIVARARRITF